MKKRIIILLAVVLAGVIIVTIVGHTLKQPSADQHMALAQAENEARQRTDLPACLNVQSQNAPDGANSKTISEVVGAKLTDRPRATAYGLYFKNFSSKSATGTIIYDGTSGNTFNFAVSRTNESVAWKLTNFEACQ